jgi:hypothetical protein
MDMHEMSHKDVPAAPCRQEKIPIAPIQTEEQFGNILRHGAVAMFKE